MLGFLIFVVQLAKAFTMDEHSFKGMFQGTCRDDGLYYNNQHSFVMCAGNNYYIQPCPPGTMNRPFQGYNGNQPFRFENFCDVNLVNSASGNYVDNVGFNDKRIPFDAVTKGNNNNYGSNQNAQKGYNEQDTDHRNKNFQGNPYGNSNNIDYGFPQGQDTSRYREPPKPVIPLQSQYKEPFNPPTPSYHAQPSNHMKGPVFPEYQAPPHHNHFHPKSLQPQPSPPQSIVFNGYNPRYPNPSSPYQNHGSLYPGQGMSNQYPPEGSNDRYSHHGLDQDQYKEKDSGDQYSTPLSDEAAGDDPKKKKGKKEDAGSFLYMVISMPKSMASKIKSKKKDEAKLSYSNKDDEDDKEILTTYHAVSEPSHGPVPMSRYDTSSERDRYGGRRDFYSVDGSGSSLSSSGRFKGFQEGDKAYYNSKDHGASQYPPPKPPVLSMHHHYHRTA